MTVGVASAVPSGKSSISQALDPKGSSVRRIRRYPPKSLVYDEYDELELNSIQIINEWLSSQKRG